MSRTTPGRPFRAADFDPADPDPWLALYLDDGLPVAESAKRALLNDNRSKSRRFLLPVLRPFILAFFVLVHVFRFVFRRWPDAPKTLHRLIYWGLKTFARPEANYLIMRHFNIGSEILGFIRDNVDGAEISTVPLRPRTLSDLKDNAFLEHDLNIYRFIIQLNASLQERGATVETRKELDFSSISGGDFGFEEFPDRWHNFVDVQTAIECYTPLYLLFLSRRDFVRASNSLQLDETIAVYVAKILGTDYHLNFVNNHHPMIPLSTLEAGYRLMMHGQDAEALYGYLCRLKKQQADAGRQAVEARMPAAIL